MFGENHWVVSSAVCRAALFVVVHSDFVETSDWNFSHSLVSPRRFHLLQIMSCNIMMNSFLAGGLMNSAMLNKYDSTT